MSREKTTRLLEMVEEGLLDRDTVIMACIKYMSEDDVADMMRLNDFEYDEDDDEDDDAPEVPADWPVQPIAPDDPDAADIATCGTCGLSWDDGKVTGMTPAPAARCPFETFHKED